MVRKEKRAILIGAGENVLMKNKSDLSNWKECAFDDSMIIALDGGLLFCEECKITPDYIIGDFDSLPEEKQFLLEKYDAGQVVRLPKEKDDTDMLAAIKFAADKGVKEFVIWGGLGGRLSHTIANLQCLRYLKEHGMSGMLLGKHTKVFLLQNEMYTFDKNERGYLSVFAYSECARGVTLQNLKYELKDAVLVSSFPIGVSNEFIGKEASIQVKDGILLIVLDQ